MRNSTMPSERSSATQRIYLGMIGGILQATKVEAEAVNVAKEEVALGGLLNEIKSSYAGSLTRTFISDGTTPLSFPA